MKATVYHNQSLLDIAIQHNGSLNNIFATCLQNGISITDALIVGSEIEVDTDEIDAEIVSYYTSKEIIPALGNEVNTASLITPSGIDYWAIENDFIVQ